MALRKHVCAALMALCALGASAAQAQAPCRSEEGNGCLTLEMFAVVNDPSNPMLEEVASGKKEPYQDDIARRIHRATKAGQVPFYQGPLDVQAYVWKSTRQGLGRIQIYDNPQGGFRKVRPGVPSPPVNAPQVPPLGPPDFMFTMKAVGKDMMITFPAEFFTPDTHIFLCAPTLPSIMPDPRRQQGLWFTSGTLPWHRATGKGAVSMFFLVRNTNPLG